MLDCSLAFSKELNDRGGDQSWGYTRLTGDQRSGGRCRSSFRQLFLNGREWIRNPHDRSVLYGASRDLDQGGRWWNDRRWVRYNRESLRSTFWTGYSSN
jgi:hypothetical protein